MKYSYPKVSFDVIEKAVGEDMEAIEQILQHYSRYMIKLSLRSLKEENGYQHMEIDESLFGNIQSRLIKCILGFEIRK